MAAPATSPWLLRFLRQPCKPYRNFQIAFFILALNFIIPAFSYTFTPAVAVGQFLELNSLLGGAPYPVNEVDSHLWRYLGAANVMTLGFMCVLLMVSLRRFFAVLVPLVFMKSFAALAWLFGFMAWTEQRWFLAAGILDSVTVVAFLFFAIGAAKASRDLPASSLVPAPR